MYRLLGEHRIRADQGWFVDPFVRKLLPYPSVAGQYFDSDWALSATLDTSLAWSRSDRF